LSKFNQEIVRIGARCNDESLKKYTLESRIKLEYKTIKRKISSLYKKYNYLTKKLQILIKS